MNSSSASRGKKKIPQCEHRFAGIVMIGDTWYCRDCGMQADEDYKGDWHHESMPSLLRLVSDRR